MFNYSSHPTSVTRPPCDFCMGDAAVWAYPCKSFTRRVVDDVHVILAGPWRACGACHRLIQADEWAKLRRRSLRLFRAAYGPLSLAEDVAVAADLGPTWMAFQRHRTGPAERIGGVV